MISNMTTVFQIPSKIYTNQAFWFQFFAFMHETVESDKFEGADFKYDKFRRFHFCRKHCLLTHSLVESLRKFLSVADLRVDGRNTYQQSQCSPQNNSNSQPEYTRLYLPVSTTLALLPAIRSSICLDPILWPAWLGKTCQNLKLP